MSRSSKRRNTTYKALPPVNRSLGSNLMFKWSIAGANSYLLEENISFTLPSIDNNRSSNQSSINVSPIIGHHSPVNASISNNRSSYLSTLYKKYNTSRLNEDDRSSRRSSPLSLSYEQLHYIHHMPHSSMKISKPNSILLQPISDNKSNSVLNSSTFDDKSNNSSFHSTSDYKEKIVTFHPVIIEKQKNVTLQPISDKRRNSVSSNNSKISSNSKLTQGSVVTAPVVSTRPEFRLSKTELVRLHTPQLRRLNVSEKYMAEAKKLYFNAYCKSFVPRIVVS